MLANIEVNTEVAMTVTAVDLNGDNVDVEDVYTGTDCSGDLTVQITVLGNLMDDEQKDMISKLKANGVEDHEDVCILINSKDMSFDKAKKYVLGASAEEKLALLRLLMREDADDFF